MKNLRGPEVGVWVNTASSRIRAARHPEAPWPPRVLGLTVTIILHGLFALLLMAHPGSRAPRVIKVHGFDASSITNSSENWMTVELIQQKRAINSTAQLAKNFLSRAIANNRIAVTIENAPPPQELLSDEEQMPQDVVLSPFSLLGVPPTETLRAVAAESDADLEASVVNEPALRDSCLRRYPGELANEPEVGGVELRVFVMADGRIGQGSIEHSSGNKRLDALTLGCLQAFGNFEPAVIANSSTGSWQRLIWFWRK